MLKPSPNWSSGCSRCPMKTHRGMGRGHARSRRTSASSEALRGTLLVMARLILLDSGPLGLIVRAPNRPQVVRCIAWLKTISSTGATVIIPEIAHYEVRRELL